MKLSVVIPFHNEEKNIPLILGSFLSFAEKYDFELICVDDASTDGSAEVFGRYSAAEYGFMKRVSVSREAHRGYGHAIMSGVREAKGEVIAWTHSDMQTDPGDVFRAFDEYVKYGDEKLVIKGRRVKRAFSQALFSFGMASVASIVLGKLLYEINAQPKLFHRSFLRYLRNAPDDFSLDLYFLYQANIRHYMIKDIEVEFRTRQFGESKWAYSFSSKVRTIMRTIKYIVKLRKSL